MKTSIRRTALTSIAILMLLGGTTAAFADSPQSLNATLTGAVTNLGTQTYSVGGGSVVYAYIGGYPIDSGTGTIQYFLFAIQSGMTTQGFANVHFSATVGGTPVSVSGSFQINGADMGAGLPAGCTTTCQEILPFDFIGSSNVQLTMGGTQSSETLLVESPYWNPYGGPIYLMSPDMAIIIVATYTQGTILWNGAQTGGAITGTFAGNQVSGTFTQTSSEYENLVTGTAVDAGTIQFNTNVPALNAKGFYTGTDTIPQAGSIDCSPASLPYTCTETGFQSDGHFRASGMSGTYSTTWGVPAYLFSSTILATVAQPVHSGSSIWSFFQNFFERR
jgi:hypothetical protein